MIDDLKNDADMKPNSNTDSVPGDAEAHAEDSGKTSMTDQSADAGTSADPHLDPGMGRDDAKFCLIIPEITEGASCAWSSDTAQAEKAETDFHTDSSSAQHTADKTENNDEKPMTLLEHLGELRARLVKAFLGILLCFFVTYGFAGEIFHHLALPLLQVMPADAKFIYTGVAEGFFVDLKVGFVAAIFMASPYLFYQIWAFIAPGLYEEEKRYVLPLSFISAIFFIGGAAFCYFIVFPFAFTFFLSYSTESIVAMLSISEYLGFALTLLIAFGIVFEMPLFSFFLSRMGLVTAKRMRSFRKYAVLAVFIIAAILTPPDIFSQVLMALPMLVLYEISIIVAVITGKKEKKQDDQKEKDQTKQDKEKETESCTADDTEELKP